MVSVPNITIYSTNIPYGMYTARKLFPEVIECTSIFGAGRQIVQLISAQHEFKGWILHYNIVQTCYKFSKHSKNIQKKIFRRKAVQIGGLVCDLTLLVNETTSLRMHGTNLPNRFH